jgi:hypothetical protein
MGLKIPVIHWHPVTRQRWARFRGLRRGWWACWLLGAYGVSLGSEWIANDKPLWIRHRGRHYFPVVKFYPEDAFTGSGRMTRPDYKALAAGGALAPGGGTRMLWPLIPYGPLESLKPENIELPEELTVTATPDPRVASADVDAAGRVVRVAGDAERFGLMAGGATGPLPREIQTGLATRFADRPAGAVDVRMEGQWISLVALRAARVGSGTGAADVSRGTHGGGGQEDEGGTRESGLSGGVPGAGRGGVDVPDRAGAGAVSVPAGEGASAGD